MRHTFGTTLAKAGTPIREIQEYMGHAHISTTEQYAHYVPRRDAAAKIAAAFRVEMPEADETPTAA